MLIFMFPCQVDLKGYEGRLPDYLHHIMIKYHQHQGYQHSILFCFSDVFYYMEIESNIALCLVTLSNLFHHHKLHENTAFDSKLESAAEK